MGYQSNILRKVWDNKSAQMTPKGLNMSKEKRVNVRVDESDLQKLNEISRRIDLPASYIVRHAIREKIEHLEQTHPLLNKPAELAPIKS